MYTLGRQGIVWKPQGTVIAGLKWFNTGLFTLQVDLVTCFEIAPTFCKV